VRKHVILATLLLFGWTAASCSDTTEPAADATIAPGELDAAPQRECSQDSDCIGKIPIQPCEMVVCNVEQDLCELGSVEENTPCNDGDPCTIDEACVGLSCEGGSPRDCDDGNVCTDDSCNAQGGCEYGFNAATCNDNDVCTEDDTCADGVCSGTVSSVCFEGDCCEAQGHPGCGDEDVRTCVCDLEPSCCQSLWTENCVSLISKNECGVCEATTCGDLTCDEEETCDSCPTDCGPCVMCGDETCDASESCSSCPDDCGECPPAVCGDDVCEDGEETCDECPEDCGVCPSVCGDGTCQLDESCETCSDDCGPCAAGCGDDVCTIDETCESCALDCGVCVGNCCEEQEGPGCDAALVKECVCAEDAFCCESEWDGVCVAQVESLACAACDVVKCGDGLCDPEVENCDKCPQDCGACPVCGDGKCDANENCESCPGDCGECTPACCETSPNPGCADDLVIEACVCAQDFFCCFFGWDQVCVNQVESFGCGNCP
jgi:hypothetical protein